METRTLDQHTEEIRQRRERNLPARQVSQESNRAVHGLVGNAMDFRMTPEQKKEWSLYVNAIA